MNAAELLRHYERVAGAPNAIPRLRQFILELAVRGKLVSQDQGDEAAGSLLRRIGAERRRQLMGGSVRASKAQELEPAQHPFALPETWAWAALGSVFLYDAGAKCEPRKLDPSYWLLELEDLEKDTGRLLARLRVSDRQSQSTKSEFRPGDVLYGKLRPYLNKVLVADEVGYSTTEIVALRAYLPLCSEYCALALRRPDFVDYVTRLGQGTKMPRLRTEDAVVAPFPLPPLAEQYRIVSKVGELMALCDRLEAAEAEREAARDRLAAATLTRLNSPSSETFADHARFALDALPHISKRPDQIEQLRQSVLGLAVRGRLGTRNDADVPVAAVFKQLRVIASRSMRRGVPVAVEVPEIVSEWKLPDSWGRFSAAELLATGALLDLKDGNHGANHPKVSEFTETGLPFITAAQVVGGLLDLKTAYRISGKALARLRVGFAKANDVIYTHKGSVGRVAVADEDCVLSPQTTYYRTNPDVLDPQYLRWYMVSDLFSDQVDLVKKQTTRDFVAISKQYGFFHALPPLPEQRRIVAKVNVLMAVCDQLEASLTASANRRTRLLEAVLHEALNPASGSEELIDPAEALSS